MNQLGYLPDPEKEPGEKPDWDANELPMMAVPLPAAWTQRKYIVNLLRQLDIGSCVPNAGFQAIRMCHMRDIMSTTPSSDLITPKLGSRLWGYYLARALHGMERRDSGTYIRNFFRAMNKFGFLPEDSYEYGYDTTRFKDPPPPLAFKRAFDQKLKLGESAGTRWWRIYDRGPALVNAIKRHMANDRFVVSGFRVSREFVNWQGYKVFDPPTASEIFGGHALVYSAYNADDEFELAGTWGKRAHDEGYHHLTADYVEQAEDTWVVETAPQYSEAA